jgi:hypothetical protein
VVGRFGVKIGYAGSFGAGSIDYVFQQVVLSHTLQKIDLLVAALREVREGAESPPFQNAQFLFHSLNLKRILVFLLSLCIQSARLHDFVRDHAERIEYSLFERTTKLPKERREASGTRYVYMEAAADTASSE